MISLNLIEIISRGSLNDHSPVHLFSLVTALGSSITINLQLLIHNAVLSEHGVLPLLLPLKVLPLLFLVLLAGIWSSLIFKDNSQLLQLKWYSNVSAKLGRQLKLLLKM